MIANQTINCRAETRRAAARLEARMAAARAWSEHARCRGRRGRAFYRTVNATIVWWAYCEGQERLRHVAAAATCGKDRIGLAARRCCTDGAAGSDCLGACGTGCDNHHRYSNATINRRAEAGRVAARRGCACCRGRAHTCMVRISCPCRERRATRTYKQMPINIGHPSESIRGRRGLIKPPPRRNN